MTQAPSLLWKLIHPYLLLLLTHVCITHVWNKLYVIQSLVLQVQGLLDCASFHLISNQKSCRLLIWLVCSPPATGAAASDSSMPRQAYSWKQKTELHELYAGVPIRRDNREDLCQDLDAAYTQDLLWANTYSETRTLTAGREAVLTEWCLVSRLPKKCLKIHVPCQNTQNTWHSVEFKAI